MNAGTGNINWWRTLGWAFYLACSWTWCIGMFLPVLLLRDYGFWGFVVFAVPNVIGAGAMGWVLRDGASERILKRHATAILSFSAITVAFQSYWLTALLAGAWWQVEVWYLGTFCVIGAALWVLVVAYPPAQGQGTKHLLSYSALVWLFSVAVGVSQSYGATYVPYGAFGEAWLAFHGMQHQFRTDRLLWLAPVCCFGFGLSPYLDATFLATRAEVPGHRGTTAFTVGFGVFFSVMLLLTLAYAPLWLLNDPPGWNRLGGSVMRFAVTLIMMHMIVQALFTSVVHGAAVAVPGRAWPASKDWQGPARRRSLITLLAALVGVVLGLAVRLVPGAGGLEPAEVMYRCFMAFYGLVFPAYVWLLMIPTRDGHSGLSGPNGRRKLLVWAGAVGIAAPMFWMGFIRQQELWLVPGLGVVLWARVLLPRTTTRMAPPTDAFTIAKD